jgi:hypothetical protein
LNNLGLKLNLIFLQFRTAISVGQSNFLKVLKENAGGIFEMPELIQTTAFSLEGRLTRPVEKTQGSMHLRVLTQIEAVLHENSFSTSMMTYSSVF